MTTNKENTMNKPTGTAFRVEVLYGHGWEAGWGDQRSERGFQFQPDKAALPDTFVSSLWSDTHRAPQYGPWNIE